ncbi:protease modulator HflC [Marinicella gelatinilytica]|uniref:protease modulator HflC n=1 Tax=Marinicella gelatinilytica TaxID=2996017 RepID=UPI002260EC7A|nr:protease modulator HflC [Marinicella gelatinilytica]MCX7545716.1 protease modulator HflC [Marinicella gelatinilytica]
MNKIISLIIGVLILAVLSSFFLFTVSERETAIKFKFGEVIQAGYEPGLHFKWPVINNIRTFDKRIQTLDNKPERVFNTDNEYLMVDYFVKWRINDVKLFYTSNEGSIARANTNLAGVFKNALLEEFSVRTLDQVISTQRVELMENLQTITESKAEDFGMEIIDVRIKQINLDQSVNESVYNRMRSERLAEAAEHRSNGTKQAINIRATTDKAVRIMVAEADKQANLIKGDGEAEAIRVYAQSYEKDPQFYSFYRSLEAYKKSFQQSGQNMMILDPDSEFFKYFKNAQP